MQFKQSQEINAPASYVFARITDYARFENGTTDARFSFKRQKRQPVRIGTRWNISVDVRGKSRRFVAELSEMVPPRTVSYKSSSSKYQAVFSLSVEQLGAEKCRVNMLLVAKSKNFATALIFNSIRIARKRINKRMADESATYAKKMADEYRASKT